MKFRAFLPRFFRKLLPQKAVRGYDSYNSALKNSHSYEDSRIIDIVLRKTKTYKQQLLENGVEIKNQQIVQNMLVMEHVFHGRTLDVIDFGGACGACYFGLNHFLPEFINRWHIVETKKMAAVGKDFFQDEKLSFYENLDEAVAQLDNLDLIIAQGVLQFTKDPLLSLKTLLSQGFSYVYVARTIVSINTDVPIITNQIVKVSEHGPGASPKGFVDSETSQPRTILPDLLYRTCIPPEYSTVFNFCENKNSFLVVRGQPIETKTIGFLLKKTSDYD